VLRARTRAHITQWSVTQIITLIVAAVIPWLVVWLAPITISLNIHTLPVLIGWLVLALAAFGGLVLLPLAAMLCVGVWAIARRRASATRPGKESGV